MTNHKEQGDGFELASRDRAECLECQGTGTTRCIVGDEDCGERCQSCCGTGLELDRDDFLRVAAQQETGDWGVPIIPEIVMEGREYAA